MVMITRMKQKKSRKLNLICLLLSFMAIFTLAEAAGRGQNVARVPMDSFKALYFKDGHKTMSRRNKPFPQLQCIGNSKHICDTYSPEIVLCKHQGDGAWKCEADLHHSVRFGTVDVSCEGWDGPKDDYVLRGSCMLRYTILPNYPDSGKQPSEGTNRDILIVVGVILFVFFFFFWNSRSGENDQGRGGSWRGGGGGGGGPNDPPPPYHPYPKQEPGTSSSSNSSTSNTTGWRPGFWTGLLGGYMANETARYMRGNQYPTNQQQRRTWFDGGRDDYDPFARGGGNSFGAAGPSRSRSDEGETRTAFGYGGSSVR